MYHFTTIIIIGHSIPPINFFYIGESGTVGWFVKSTVRADAVCYHIPLFRLILTFGSLILR